MAELKAEVLTAKEAAKILRITYNQMLSLLKSGAIPSLKIGRAYRISSKTIQDLVETKESVELSV